MSPNPAPDATPDPEPPAAAPMEEVAAEEDGTKQAGAGESDGALASFGDLAADLAVFAETLEDEEAGVAMSIDRMTIDLPVELEVRVGEDGRVALGSEPPTQYTDTSVMPVFHRLRITLGGPD
ncbi:hypothetical protein N825_27685 [Skermanella stibiiresistens SB22]|uniref:Uncharacterized protein n=1 Tax=Skermanella stibiiresistens SB22 TaxID=1385369 RepID=W9H5I9_9PROT|nr:hypothetical protein [Skermanella stibiiresistens]EWY41500.1 hypothetical protein N825_27685 [Skermanella stibiiresistens SB22]